MNELDVEWVGERTWIYSTTFVAPSLGDGEQADLVFEGLDTLCTVYLNGDVILQTENMFIGHRVNVSQKLRSGQENKLVLVFESALHRGRELESQHVEHRFIAHNGEPGRLGVRKAQYHWVSKPKRTTDINADTDRDGTGAQFCKPAAHGDRLHWKLTSLA